MSAMQPLQAKAVGKPKEARVVPNSPRGWLHFCLFFYWNAFLMGFGHQLVLMAVLGGVAAIIFGGFGSGLGLPSLFWHDTWWKQFLAGVMVAALNTEVILVGFLLDTRRPPKFRRWVERIPAGHRGFDPQAPHDRILPQVSAYFFGGVACIVASGLAVGGLVALARHVSPLPPGKPDYMYFIWHRGVVANLYLPLGLIVGSVASLLFTRWWLNRIDETRDVTRFNFLVPKIKSPAEKKLHLAALANLGLAFLAYAAIPLAFLLFHHVAHEAQIFVTPAVSLCLFLVLVVGIYGAIKFHVPGYKDSFTYTAVLTNGSFLIALVVLLMALGGVAKYKHRFPNMDYAKPVAIPDDGTYPLLPKPQLVRSEDVTFATGGKPKPMVIVCASGGGIRSATWTVAILRQLERNLGPDFPYHIRLMTGASGGMLGSAYYVSTLKHPAVDRQSPSRHAHVTRTEADAITRMTSDEQGDDFLIDSVCQDQLSEPVKSMIFFDVPAMIGITFAHDRGQALEGEWDRMLAYMNLPFYSEQNRAAEKAGWRPSLVLAPMLAEDGRRLFISNLDLDFLAIDTGDSFHKGGVVDPQTTYSRCAYEFSRLFPGAMNDFRMSTAVRMNASFPYVAPAAVLPTTPRRRVVDAGYYDDYGVDVAARWLDHMMTSCEGRKWLKQNASGVVLIQIRDGINTLDYRSAAPQNEKTPSALSRGVEWLTTPIDGVLSARDSVAIFRNDQLLQHLTQMFQAPLAPANQNKKDAFPPNYFCTVRFEYNGEAALTWSMADSEVADIKSHARRLSDSSDRTSDHPTVDDENVWQMQALKAWWAGSSR